MRCDVLCDGDGTRRCQCAIIHTGAGDNVGNQSNVCGGQPDGAQCVIDVGQMRFVHMGQDDILFMTDAQLVM